MSTAEETTMSEPGLACCTPLTGTPMSAAQAEQVAPLLRRWPTRSGCGWSA